jgi:NADH dehydrogenase
LVRVTSDPAKVSRLRGLGMDVVQGDLKDRSSLDAACRGASVAISTASSTLSRREGDSIESVDRQGQLNLVEAAEVAGVKHFVLISFPNVDIDFPLQSAKRAVEDRLRRGRMKYTILQPTCFMEVWLSPALGFDPARASVQVYGRGHNKISWISFQDVAKFAVAALDNPRASNKVIKLGGPDALSPLEVVRLAEQAVGKQAVVQHVPEEALRAQYDAATESLQKSLAALMLYHARGDVIDMTEAMRALPVRDLRSVREFLQATA